MHPGVPSWHHWPPRVWPAKATVDTEGADACLPPDGEKKSGNAKMHRATNNSFLVTERSSKEFIGITSLPNCPRLYQELAFSLILERSKHESFTRFGNMLVAAAEYAYPIYDNESLKEAALLLTTLPLPNSYRNTGLYYQGLCAVRQRDYRQARAIFNTLVERGDPTNRARALISLGTIYHALGDLENGLGGYLEAMRALTLDDCHNPLPFILAKLNIAIHDSDVGNHRQSLQSLEGIFPIVQMMGPRHPQEYYSFLNGLAVELGEAGRFEEARNVIKLVLRSPIAHAYPQWFATRDEIIEKEGRASRSKVVIWRGTAAPNNILHLPAPAPEAGPELVESPPDLSPRIRARILKFKNSKKRTGIGMARSKDSEPEEPAKQLSRKQKVIRIVELVTNNLTDKQLDQILDAIEDIAPEK
jgi:tetratricopeptide (TPR) repeat protein